MGAYDIWAGGRGAEGYKVDSPKYLTLSHPAMAKPRSATEALSQRIMDELRKHRHPSALLERVQQIRASDSERDAFVKHWAAKVIQMVGEARPELDKRGRQIKAATLLVDFLVDFQKRPLRVLDMRHAVPLYVRRSLGGPF